MTPFDALTDRDLHALRVADPVPAEAADAATAVLLPGIRATVMDQVRHPGASLAGRPSPKARGGRPVWAWRAAIGAAAVAVAAATVTLTHQTAVQATPALPVPLSFTTGTPAAGAAFLNHAATVLSKPAAASSETVRYTSVQSYAPQTSVRHHKVTTTVGTTVFDIWYAPTGTSQVQEYSQAQDLAGGDVGGPAPVKNADHTGWSNWPDPNRGISSDPATARTQLSRQIDGWSSLSPADQAVDLETQIVYNLQTGTATNAQLAVYYRILASTAGVFDAGIVTDRLGRSGHAVGLPMPGQEAGNSAARYVIVDPKTGHVLQTETDMTRPPSALKLPNRPWVDEYHIIRDSRMVSSLGGR